MAYSSKQNVNILTSLLLAYGVKHIVVCPGSRNAPLVHNFTQCQAFTCHSVTDERSAGFVALGLSLKMPSQPVCVCVTSGSALLNVMPAVAEATYQQRGIIVISADRPEAWIDQLDGQTIPQKSSLGDFVAKSVSLPEPCDETQTWHCRRLVCEAMIAWQQAHHPSVHINVPISEPLFDFSQPSFPDVKSILLTHVQGECLTDLRSAKRPMVVFGQMDNVDTITEAVYRVFGSKVVLLHESLSVATHFPDPDLVMLLADKSDDLPEPDLIIYIGGHIVSKRLRHYLRKCTSARTWMIGVDHQLRDVSMHADALWVTNDYLSALFSLTAMALELDDADKDYLAKWHALQEKASSIVSVFSPEYSSMLAVQSLFEQKKTGDIVFAANSSAVRLANIYANEHVRCNRGVNGIEGCMSTAAGFSLAESANVYCITGDLSFFYDQNALWNKQLKGNFRVLLLNNQEGVIFRNLPGLDASPAQHEYVSAAHSTTAEGVAVQHDLQYFQATDAPSLRDGIEWLCSSEEDDRPRLLEVLTDGERDAAVLKAFYSLLRL